MNPHQPKVVATNGLMLGPCFRAICKCGWMSRLYPITQFGTGVATDKATREGEDHVKKVGLATKLAMPDFLTHLNENAFTVEEPSWKP